MRKTVVSIAAAAVMVTLLGSCVSLQDREMGMQEKAEANIVGTVTAKFTIFRGLHFISSSKKIKQKAYQELMKEAQKKYPGNVEVRNISISGGFSIWELLWVGGFTGAGAAIDGGAGQFVGGTVLGAGLGLVTGHFEKITATGDVVEVGAGSSRIILRALDEALSITAAKLIDDLPRDATIAILSVHSDDQTAAEHVISELEFKFVDARKFKIVDRRRLEQIRREQNFQTSGEVSDDSAVSIGNMLGATIVITGDITGAGSNHRLVLRALDVQTAQIITMVREQF